MIAKIDIGGGLGNDGGKDQPTKKRKGRSDNYCWYCEVHNKASVST